MAEATARLGTGKIVDSNFSILDLEGFSMKMFSSTTRA
jgi:hypothetical protein